MMTKKEFFACIASTENTNITEEMRSFAEYMLEQMEREANNRKAKNAEKSAEKNAAFREQILEVLKAEPSETFTTSEIAEALEVSVQKASAILRGMVAEGILNVADVKVPKTGKQKGYSLASHEE